jgi:hypothetical protein
MGKALERPVLEVKGAAAPPGRRSVRAFAVGYAAQNRLSQPICAANPPYNYNYSKRPAA